MTRERLRTSTRRSWSCARPVPFPHRGFREPTQFFCGAPVQPGKPYCLDCCQWAYVPLRTICSRDHLCNGSSGVGLAVPRQVTGLRQLVRDLPQGALPTFGPGAPELAGQLHGLRHQLSVGAPALNLHARSANISTPGSGTMAEIAQEVG